MGGARVGLGRLGFPEDHPNFQGVLPPAIAAVAQTLEGHDLVLVAGAPVFRYYPYIPGPLLPEGTSLVMITSDPDEAVRAPMGDAIVGDVAHALEALLAQVPASERSAPAPRPRARPAARVGARSAASEAAAVLAEVFPPDGVLVNEAPSSVSRSATSCVSRGRAATSSAPAAASGTACRRRSACSWRSPTGRSWR